LRRRQKGFRVHGEQNVAQRLADVHAVDKQFFTRTGVDVHQHAEGVAAERLRQDTGRRTDSALEPERVHARPRAHAAAHEITGLRSVEHRRDVGG
jgi:hypothetical protein